MKPVAFLLGTSWVFASLTAYAQDEFYSDDFERADGPLDGWTIAQGTASILDGRLVIGPTSQEHWLWAGDPAVEVPASATAVTYSFDLEFLAPGNNAVVGRHGGMAFCAPAPTLRGVGFNGYYVDWIDRVDDFGFRLTRAMNGVDVQLVGGTPAAESC